MLVTLQRWQNCFVTVVVIATARNTQHVEKQSQHHHQNQPSTNGLSLADQKLGDRSLDSVVSGVLAPQARRGSRYPGPALGPGGRENLQRSWLLVPRVPRAVATHGLAPAAGD